MKKSPTRLVRAKKGATGKGERRDQKKKKKSTGKKQERIHEPRGRSRKKEKRAFVVSGDGLLERK